ncbi:MAG: hypothetical protein QNJ72_12905 [Pleurocapsa sp. MO_226.B13]|nr:hypothetical protein [Pleurocapsa sp. MO_226.B13]
MNQHQSQFPNHQSELNYALSDEPILLNGMKVIFDQQAYVYPVDLQLKDRKLLNTSLAKSFGNNNNFSGALNLRDWKNVLNLTINKKALNRDGRLSNLAENPWMLDQGSEGNCGFAAVFMAMLFLDNNKKNVIKELLNAIYFKNKYKNMTVTEGINSERNSERVEAKNGVIKRRIETRLSKYVEKYVENEVEQELDSPKRIADYVLIMGLLLFFEDYLKYSSGEAGKNLWYKKIMPYNDIFVVYLEKQIKQKNDNETRIRKRTATRLASMDEGEKMIPGYKKGDLGLTQEGLLALCKSLRMRCDLEILYPEEQYSPKRKKYIFLPKDRKDKWIFKKHNFFCLEFDDISKIFENNKNFPCILGVAGEKLFYKQKNEEEEKNRLVKFEKFKLYNFLEHWIFMPTKNEVWTWGNKYQLYELGQNIEKEKKLKVDDAWHWIPTYLIRVIGIINN